MSECEYGKCGSCYEMVWVSELVGQCPLCGWEVCVDCRVFGGEGEMFSCQRCADRIVAYDAARAAAGDPAAGLTPAEVRHFWVAPARY